MIRPLEFGPRHPADSAGRRAQPSSFADVMDAVQRRRGEGAASGSRDATRPPSDHATEGRARSRKAEAGGSPEGSPDSAAASRDAAAAAATAPAAARQDPPAADDQCPAAGDGRAVTDEDAAAQPPAAHDPVEVTIPLPGPVRAHGHRRTDDAHPEEGLPVNDVAPAEGSTAGGDVVPAADTPVRPHASPSQSVQSLVSDEAGHRVGAERDDNRIAASQPPMSDPAVPGAVEQHGLPGELLGDLASGRSETAGHAGLSSPDAPAGPVEAGNRRGNAAGESQHEPPAVSLQEASPVAVRSGGGSSGAASPPGLSASVERVVALAEQLRHAPPPRTVTVDLEGLGGPRVVVSLRGEAVTIAPVAGAPLDSGFNSDLSRSLAERGLHLAGDGEADGSGRRHREEEDARPSHTGAAAPRRPAFGRSRRDDGIRL